MVGSPIFVNSDERPDWNRIVQNLSIHSFQKTHNVKRARFLSQTFEKLLVNFDDFDVAVDLQFNTNRNLAWKKLLCTPYKISDHCRQAVDSPVQTKQESWKLDIRCENYTFVSIAYCIGDYPKISVQGKEKDLYVWATVDFPYLLDTVGNIDHSTNGDHGSPPPSAVNSPISNANTTVHLVESLETLVSDTHCMQIQQNLLAEEMHCMQIDLKNI